MSPAASASDLELVVAARRGDRAAVAALYGRFFDGLYDFLVRTLGDPEEASDAVQDVFIKAFEVLDTLEQPDRFKAWLFTIAHRDALNRIRRRRTVAHLSGFRQGGETGTFDVVDTDRLADPYASAEAAAAGTMVWEAAAGLDRSLYAILDLHVRQGLESPELAEVLGLSKNHAAVKLNRVKAALRQSVGALCMLQQGRRACATLDAEVSGATVLSPQIRKRIEKHVNGCASCQAQRQEMLSPEAVLSSLALVPALGSKVSMLQSLLQTLTTQQAIGTAVGASVAGAAAGGAAVSGGLVGAGVAGTGMVGGGLSLGSLAAAVATVTITISAAVAGLTVSGSPDMTGHSDATSETSASLREAPLAPVPAMVLILETPPGLATGPSEASSGVQADAEEISTAAAVARVSTAGPKLPASAAVVIRPAVEAPKSAVLGNSASTPAPTPTPAPSPTWQPPAQAFEPGTSSSLQATVTPSTATPGTVTPEATATATPTPPAQQEEETGSDDPATPTVTPSRTPKSGGRALPTRPPDCPTTGDPARPCSPNGDGGRGDGDYDPPPWDDRKPSQQNVGLRD